MSGDLGYGSNQIVSGSWDEDEDEDEDEKLREVFRLFQERCALLCGEEFFFFLVVYLFSL